MAMNPRGQHGHGSGGFPDLRFVLEELVPLFEKGYFLVITFEIINSAIENVVDLASNYHFSMLAKNAKDMAAGAVLVISGYAVVTGLIIFVPKIIAMIFGQ